MHTAIRFFVLTCLLYLSAATAVGAANVGFRKVESEDLSFGIWYPTEEPTAPLKLGPFDVVYAVNAPPAEGVFPLVVMSHGHTGRYRNHHLTASLLAENGFIVVAPQHTKDRWARAGRVLAAVAQRVSEIRTTLAAVQAMPVFKPVIDAENVSAIGYSLGGATVLTAAGMKFDMAVLIRHCRQNIEKDEAFCGTPGPVWSRVYRWLRTLWFSAIHSADPEAKPLSFRKIALVAPVGHVFDPVELANLQADVLILRFEHDALLRYPFHSEYLRAHIPPQRVNYAVLAGHHQAFIAPFPKSLTKQEPIPVAIDPPGFDRATFIDGANRKILAFLRD